MGWMYVCIKYSTRSSSSDRVPPLAKEITKPPNDIKIGSFRQNPNLSCGYGIYICHFIWGLLFCLDIVIL